MRRHLTTVLILSLLGWLNLQEPVRKIGQVGQGLRVASVSPDGQLVVGWKAEAGGRWSYAVWQTQSGKEIVPAQLISDPPASSNPFAWGPDGLLAVGYGDQVALWQGGKLKRKLKADWMVRDVRFSGPTLMARVDKGVFLWTAATGKLIWGMRQEHLLAARLSSNGKTLATASLEEPIFVFDVTDKRLIGQLPAGQATVNLEFCHQDEWLACAFRYRSDRQKDCALVYHWPSARPLSRPLSNPALMGFAVSQDGERLLTRSASMVRIWEGGTGNLVHQKDLPSGAMDALSPDGRLVATVAQGQVELWRSQDGRSLASLREAEPVTAVSLPSNGVLGVLAGSCSVYALRADWSGR
ncbi:MAG: hypothetical protein AMXMBFR33_31360 [Candidatus Xenobia bacterium]